MQPARLLNPLAITPEYKGKQMTCANCNRQDMYYEDGVAYFIYKQVDGGLHWVPFWFCSFHCVLVVQPEGTA